MATNARTGRPRSLWRKALFVVVTTLFVFLCVELASAVGLSLLDRRLATPSRLQSAREDVATGRTTAQADEPQPTGQQRLDLKEPHVLHPYLGFVQDPEGDVTLYKWHLNLEAASFGFPRNVHPLLAPPSTDRMVVAVVGGSVSRQIGYQGRLQLEQRIARIGRFRGRKVEVVALGMGGYKQPQQVMVLNYLLALGMQVDMVVNIDGFNEVALPAAENVPEGVHPAFPRDWAFRVGALEPEERRARGEITFLGGLRQRNAKFFSRSPWRLSPTCSLLWRVFDRWLESAIGQREAALQASGPGDRSFQATGPAYSPRDEPGLYRDLADLWYRCSILINQLASARGIEYYHFLQPNQYLEGSKKLTAEELRTAWRESAPYREPVVLGYPVLEARGEDLKRAGVAFTDLAMLFKDVPGTIYVDTCCHYNSVGIGMVVDRIVATVGSGPGVAGTGARASR